MHPDPLKELLDLQDRMNRLFDETLSRERLDDMDMWAPSWVPVADVYDTPDAYLLEIELPGLARPEIDIQVKGRELVVRGERHPAGPAGSDTPAATAFSSCAQFFINPDPILPQPIRPTFTSIIYSSLDA